VRLEDGIVNFENTRVEGSSRLSVKRRLNNETCRMRPKSKLHYWKGVPVGIPIRGPIGTRKVSSVSVRPAQSVFRVGFVKKWTRERHRPVKGPERPPVYCNRRPRIREPATCLLQPSTQPRPVCSRTASRSWFLSCGNELVEVDQRDFRFFSRNS
jgi:hypothetical protein